MRYEIAEPLRDDPFGAGPQSAFAAAAVVAALLAAVGFAVSTAGSMRARGDEFALLRALGAPRRQLARLVAAEQGILVALALVVGLALGAVLTRAVMPLIVLTSGASRPVPGCWWNCRSARSCCCWPPWWSPSCRHRGARAAAGGHRPLAAVDKSLNGQE